MLISFNYLRFIEDEIHLIHKDQLAKIISLVIIRSNIFPNFIKYLKISY